MSILSAVANVAGGLLSNRRNESNANKQADLQKLFAKNSVQWKVADAKKAGIHPLYALGANTTSYAPIAINDSLGPALQAAGQDVSRAMYANADSETRGNVRTEALRLENMGLQNDLLRAQIAKLNSQVGPPVPTSFPVSSGDVVTRDLVSVEPSKVTSARSEDSSTEAGPAGPAYKEHDAGILGKWKLPSGAVSESLDDMELAKYALIAGANHEKLGYLKNVAPNLIYQYLNAPDWVERTRKRFGHRVMIPFYKSDGKLYWKGLGSVRR